jgi:hypothetical protein
MRQGPGMPKRRMTLLAIAKDSAEKLHALCVEFDNLGWHYAALYAKAAYGELIDMIEEKGKELQKTVPTSKRKVAS